MRRSSRVTKGNAPERYGYNVNISDEPKTYLEAINSPQKDIWLKAMKEEIDSLHQSKTWELVAVPENTNIVSCKWTYKIKRNIDGNIERCKARLVARGFSQKYGCDYDEVFAPVISQRTFRTLLSVAGAQGLSIYHLDVKSAFLNGDLEETIYMQQPPGFEEGNSKMVCKLKKSIYGLKQAANVWNKTLHKVVISAEYVQSKADPCLYTKYDNEEGILAYLLVYVDDILVASKSNEEILLAINLLGSHFDINNLGKIKKYLGIEVYKDKDFSYYIRQKHYIQNLLNEFQMDDAKPSKYPLDPGYGKTESKPLDNNKEYQKLIGSLLFLSVNSRPDIATSVSILARKVSLPTIIDWNELKRVLKYLKGTIEYYLRLSSSDKTCDLIGYADANWAEDKIDRKSNSGYIFQLNKSTISWSCKKQSSVALSSTEAEFVALSEACKEAIWLRKLLRDMKIIQSKPTKMFEDNQSCLRLATEERLSNRTKHIDTKVHFIKEHIDQKTIQCVYCPTEDMIADIMTKPLSAIRHSKLRSLLGLVLIEEGC